MVAWLTGWNYRKKLTINSAAGAGTNYQKCVKIYKAAGVDGTENYTGLTVSKMYANLHCQDDFDDIRFTDDDGDTLLDCWIETKVDGDYAVFWVEVKDDLTAANEDIYVYYDNGTAVAVSNGANTFPLLFDHFIGVVPDPAIWTVTGAPVCADSIMTLLVAQDVKSKTSFGVGSVASRSRAQATQLPNDNAILIVGFYTKTAPEYACAFYICKPVAVPWVRGRNLKNGASSIVNMDEVQDFNYHVWEARWPSSAASTRFQIDGGTEKTIAANVPNVATPVLLYSRPVWNGILKVDWSLVRKYVNPEPAHGAWAAEENNLPPSGPTEATVWVERQPDIPQQVLRAAKDYLKTKLEDKAELSDLETPSVD